MKKIFSAFVAALLSVGFSLIASPTVFAASQVEDPEHSHTAVTICHATPPDTAKNGWQEITVDDDAIVNHNGHDTDHDADIIPVFDYWVQNDDDSWTLVTFPGKNLATSFSGSTGAQILAAHCVLRAAASVTITPATCESPELLSLDPPTNATWGEVVYDGDSYPRGYSVTAEATSGATFADGDPGDNSMKTFTGTLAGPDTSLCGEEQPDPETREVVEETVSCEDQQVTIVTTTYTTPYIFDEESEEWVLGEEVAGEPVTTYRDLTSEEQENCPQTELDATAELSTLPATCESGEQLVLGAVENASWGVPTLESGPGAYSVIATADPGHAFASTLTTSEFTGSLDGALDPESPECELDTFDLVEPTISSTPITCAANGSFTIDGFGVVWTADGVPIDPGTYAVNSARTVTLVAAPGEGHGFAFDQQTTWVLSFTGIPDCLPTLALTGTDALTPLLRIAALLLFLGAASMFYTRRQVLA